MPDARTATAPAVQASNRPVHDRRRRRWFLQVADGFHLRFVLTNVVGLAIALLALSAVAFLPTIVALRSTVPGRAEAAASRFLLLHSWLWPALVAILTFATVQLIVTTHRVAGPLVRFRAVFREIRDGNYLSVVKLRDRDYLGLEAQALNEALDGLRTRGDRACATSRQLVEALRELAAHDERPRGTGGADIREVLVKAEHLHAVLSGSTPSPAAPSPLASGEGRGPRRLAEGFTLVELLLVAALVAVLVAMAVPSYWAALEEARVARAIGDIKAIEKELLVYRLTDGRLPQTLAEIGRDTLRDPWGHPYYYLSFDGLFKDGSATLMGTSGPGDPVGTTGPGGQGQGGNSGGDGGGGGGQNDKPRKDRNLHPLNSDFDLYSAGPDGETVPPISAKASQDDIIRASDGGFVGRASRF